MSIILLEPIHRDAVAVLDEVAPTRLAETSDELEHALAQTTVLALITRGKGRIPASLFERCPALQVVARCGVGLDNIDLQAAQQRRIPVIYAPGSTTQAVAEHTLMLMLAAARRLNQAANAVRAGAWDFRNGYQGHELAGKTLGVVGLGATGRRVAELADAVGMQVVYWSRRSRDQRFRYQSLTELLQQADVVSLHLELTPETHHLIGATELALCKPEVLLVNTSRGALINQAALIHALHQGRLGGFAADVLDPEPPAANEPWLSDQRVTLTPHIAVLTDATYRRMCVQTAQSVVAVLRGEEPPAQHVYRHKTME
jgi:phosphoglycerate dehydrogenase-like enzyme